MTRDAVLAAAERLLQEQGGRLSMRGLAAAVAATPAALYHHVPGGITELLGALAARVLHRCTGAATQAATMSAREDALGKALAAVYAVVAGKPALARVAASPGCGTPEMHEAWLRLIDVLADPAWQCRAPVPRGILSSLVMSLLLVAAGGREPRTEVARALITAAVAGARQLAPRSTEAL